MTDTQRARELLAVAQEDRGAAARWFRDHRRFASEQRVGEQIALGQSDSHPLVQAFARHREAALATTPGREGIEAADDWRDISSAPKDGTPILVYFNRPGLGIMRVTWDDPHGDDPYIWCVDDNKHGPYAVRGYLEGDDTHWQPLPEPPAAIRALNSGAGTDTTSK